MPAPRPSGDCCAHPRIQRAAPARPSEEPAQEPRRFVRDARNLVRGLTIELEVELSFRPTVLPVGTMPEFATAQASFRTPSHSDDDTDPRCLPSDPAFLRDRLG